MIVSLFTSRIVLDVLGADNFGIYNLIGGVIVLFSFLNAALQSSTQRYLNYFLGKNQEDDINRVFCMSMNSYFILSAIVLLLSETVGLWFVNTQLNIPSGRMFAANCIYQLVIIQFISSLIRIPYTASIVAYECMDFYAYMSIIEVVLKLICVYILYIGDADKLIIYGILNTIVSIVVTFWGKAYCSRKFTSTGYKRLWDSELFKKMFSFSGWSLFGSLANMLEWQSLNILINIFYGVVVNAAVGIANQVSGMVSSLYSNFQTAFQPQIVKDYARGEYNQFFKLLFSASKFSYYLMIILAFPIILTINPLLSLWLKEVPQYTGVICKIVIIISCFNALSSPLWYAVQATGEIKRYQLMMSLIIICSIPLFYLMLKFGSRPYYAWFVILFIDAVTAIVRWLYLKKVLSFPLSLYIKKVIVPVLTITVLFIPVYFLLKIVQLNMVVNIITTAIVTEIVLALLIYGIGLNNEEKNYIKIVILSKFNSNNHVGN